MMEKGKGIKGEVMEAIDLINKVSEEEKNTKKKSKIAKEKMAKLMLPIIQRCYEIAWSFELEDLWYVGLSKNWYKWMDEDDFTFVGIEDERLEFVLGDNDFDNFYIPIYCLEGDIERFFNYCKEAKTKELCKMLEELEKETKEISDRIYNVSVKKYE